MNNWFYFSKEDKKMAEAAFKEKIFNQTCFHSQQAVEKMLKGFLRARGINVPRTHFLVELVKICIEIDDVFTDLRDGCSVLDDYYIPTRYPDAIPGSLPKSLPQEKDAAEALAILKRTESFIKDRLKKGK
jgi:HEPN domain-containing protein